MRRGQTDSRRPGRAQEGESQGKPGCPRVKATRTNTWCSGFGGHGARISRRRSQGRAVADSGCLLYQRPGGHSLNWLSKATQSTRKVVASFMAEWDVADAPRTYDNLPGPHPEDFIYPGLGLHPIFLRKALFTQ